ncbi:hypothetical protein IE53DRAFT_362785 [Violaceomyces palustris]|uniref:Uncharacterized protein n=1 Tax=Violaceomyces palustris TaxID=1673888 RepID=A0ACD0NVP7_9BASI|nr:hypothetical protein IE53DRAFT_362785 [Violaceomyces palustris]
MSANANHHGQAHANPHSNSPSSDDAELTSPANLRKLVLNYLVHHCYIDTAQAFAKDGISDNLYHPSSSSFDPAKQPSSSSLPSSSSSKRPQAIPSRTLEPPPSRPNATVASTSSSSSSGSRQAHPLAAPPLSRDDSSMEIEVESLLTLSHGGAIRGSSSRHSDPRAIPSSAAGSANAPYSSMAEEQDESMAGNAPARATNGDSNGAAPKQRNGRAGAPAKEGDAEDEQGEVALAAEGRIAENESAELSSEELAAVKARKEIRDHIINGRIRLAIDMCNAHFPSVLNSDAGPSSSASSSKAKAAPPAPRTSSGTNPSTVRTNSPSSRSDKVLPANPTSLEPSHLLLNLQIQFFIESIRTASHNPPHLVNNGVTSMSSSGTLHTLASSTPGIASSISRAASPAPSSSSSGSATSTNGGGPSSSSSSSTVNPALHAALAYAKGLYTSAQRLPGYWKSMYLKELEQVTALLAYRDVEHSPVRKYLHPSRKIALAEQVNSAIMYRTGKPSQPLIESAVRQTTFVWSHLHDERVQVPLGHPVLSLGNGVDSTGVEELSSGNAKKNNGRVLPKWNFRSFLDER